MENSVILIHNGNDFKLKIAGNEIKNVISYNIACDAEENYAEVSIKFAVKKKNLDMDIKNMSIRLA